MESLPPPPAPLTVEDEQWHRLSPRMLLVHPVVEIGRALPALIGLFFAGGSRGSGHVWSLIGAGVVALLSLSRWFTTRLRITPDQVQLRHGLIFRKRLATSRERIRTVDVTSHLLHRVLGLARVVIGTGTNDRKGSGRIALDGLLAAQAQQLRDDLLHRRAAPATSPTQTADAGADDQLELARLDRRWIRLAPFTLSGVITGLVVWGFYWRIQGESGVNLTRSGPLPDLARRVESLPVLSRILVVVGAMLIFVVVTSTVGYVLAFWNFRLTRHDGGTLQVTRGLITTRATSIERRRLVGVHVAEPVVLRLVGAARTTAIATGLRTGRGSERGGEVLLPPAPYGTALAVATQVLDGATAPAATLRAHPRTARRRHVTRAVLGALVLTSLAALAWWAGASPWLPGVVAASLVLAVPLGLDRYASLGHTVADGYLSTRVGSIIRRRSTLHLDAVIGWNLRSSFFQRRLGLTTVTATTAAGRQAYSVVDVDPMTAMALLERVTPGLAAPFRRSPTAPPATSPSADRRP